MHHILAITIPPLRESCFYKEEPLFLRPDPTHEVEACKKDALNCREWELPEPSSAIPGLKALSIHFLTFPLGKGQLGALSAATALPGSSQSWVRGGRAGRARGRFPRPVSRRLPPATTAFQPDLQPGLARGAEAGERAGAERGSLCAPPRRITVPSFRAAAAGPASRWGPESRRASAREGGSTSGSVRRRPPSPALCPAPPQPWRSAAPSRRRSAGTRRGTRPGLGGGRVGVARLPGLAARSGACSPRLARPAGRAAARRFFVSAVESAPALHAHAPAPGAPTKGTGEEATALTPAPAATAATADSTRGVRFAPAPLHPRLHTHTEAAVQSCGLRDTGAPRFPRGLGGHPFSRPRGRWMTWPALCFMHGPGVHLLGVSHPPRTRFSSSLQPGPNKNWRIFVELNYGMYLEIGHWGCFFFSFFVGVWLFR